MSILILYGPAIVAGLSALSIGALAWRRRADDNVGGLVFFLIVQFTAGAFLQVGVFRATPNVATRHAIGSVPVDVEGRAHRPQSRTPELTESNNAEPSA